MINILFGFTFSFPFKQPNISTGILLQWNKLFNIPNVTNLIHESFKKYNINGNIDVIINDTVGTLLYSSFLYPNKTKIGLIIDTVTNAAYIEPLKNNEIINIEKGLF